jgi:hypothetical protein
MRPEAAAHQISEGRPDDPVLLSLKTWPVQLLRAAAVFVISEPMSESQNAAQHHESDGTKQKLLLIRIHARALRV